MKRISILFLLVLLLGSCSYYNKIDIGNLKVSALKLESTTNAKLSLKVNVANGSNRTITVIAIDGLLYKDNTKFATIRLVEPASIAPTIHDVVTLNTQVSLIDPIALLSTGLNLSKYNPEDFLVDGMIVVKPNIGIKKKIKIKGMPITELVKNMK